MLLTLRSTLGANPFILHRLLSQKDIELDTINNHTVLRTPGGADSDDYTNFVTYRRTGVTLLIIVRFENARSLVANWPTDIYFYRQVRAMHLAGRGARGRFVRNFVSLGAKYALYRTVESSTSTSFTYSKQAKFHCGSSSPWALMEETTLVLSANLMAFVSS